MLLLKIFRNTRISSFKVNETCTLYSIIITNTAKIRATLFLTVEIVIRMLQTHTISRNLVQLSSRASHQHQQQQRNLSPSKCQIQNAFNSLSLPSWFYERVPVLVCECGVRAPIECVSPVVFIICIFSCSFYFVEWYTLFPLMMKMFFLLNEN